MSPAKREELYRRLAEAMPEPKSELEYTTPFELWSRWCSRRRLPTGA